MTKLGWFGIGVFVLALAAAVALFAIPAPTKGPATFTECEAAGYSVAESYPRVCITPNGGHFTEEIATTTPTGEMAGVPSVITVTSPFKNAKITSPLVATGWARGWYFEASFPIEIRNTAGTVIGQGYAEAQTDWMTSEPVNFVSIPIAFPPQPTGSTGTVVFKKDNPSGLPEHDQELAVPVVF